jgi:hypothetical protein
MPIISDLMGTTLSQSEEKKRGSRMGRPNYPRELRERLAAAACEPMVLKRSSKMAGSNSCLRPRFCVLRPRGFSGMFGIGRLVNSALILVPQSSPHGYIGPSPSARFRLRFRFQALAVGRAVSSWACKACDLQCCMTRNTQ